MRALISLLVLAPIGILAAARDPSNRVARPFTSAAFGDVCGSCYDCSSGTAVGHAFTETPWGVRSGTAHACFLIDCTSDAHPLCGLVDASQQRSSLPEEEQRLLKAAAQVANGNVNELVTLLKEHPRRAIVNQSRAALQVLAACSPQRVIAHVPLSSDQLNAILSADND